MSFSTTIENMFVAEDAIPEQFKLPAEIQLKSTILSGTKLSICTSLNTPNEIKNDRNTAALAIPPLH